MKILALDTGQKSCSVAILEDEKTLLEMCDNRGMTHSHTVLEMIRQLLQRADLSLSEIDAFALTVGPGSFTGLRIGISAVKGLVFDSKQPILPVSSLEALAENVGYEGMILPVMDARAGRVFGAVFEREVGELRRLSEDQVLEIPEFIQLAAKMCEGKRAILVGDGAKLCANINDRADLNLLPPDHRSLAPLSAGAVGRVGRKKLESGEQTTAEALLPTYFQKPKAERMKEEATGRATGN